MEKIFVSIASYRDRRCSTTIMSLFEKAKFPERIIVGVCQQNKNDKELCTPKNFKYAKQIRVIHKHFKEAKGPTFARYLCSTLFADEDYLAFACVRASLSPCPHSQSSCRTDS